MEDKIKSTSNMEFDVILKLNEAEARALYNITVYGSKQFLEVFYKHLGSHYLQPHEKGLLSLFETINEELPKHIKKFDDTRDVFSGRKCVEVIKNTSN